MKKILIFVPVVIIILAIAFFVFNNGSKKKENMSVTGTSTITIKSFSFDPPSLLVKQGTTVTWINQDSASHDIKSDIFSSPVLQTGDKFEFTFEGKGSFNYFCGIHPGMRGTVFVE